MIRHAALSMAILLLLASPSFATGPEKAIHTFQAKPGAIPLPGVVEDSAGNLYGTTVYGGGKCRNGCGTVFEMSPLPGVGWAFKTIYVFQDSADGYQPVGPLLIGASGELYGTTSVGGQYNYGIVFELVLGSKGQWQKETLYNFGAFSGDATQPNGGVIADSSGNLYGVANYGGAYGAGAVFQLVSNLDGTWSENILFDFAGDQYEGGHPNGPLTFDTTGNLYGTALLVFELSPSSQGPWTENVLFDPSSQSASGYVPTGGVIFDAAGNLYGVNMEGGSTEDAGAVYELSPAQGFWIETTLHQFRPSTGDGSEPDAPLTFDARGNLIGTTATGGAYGYGTIFRLTQNGYWIEDGRYSFTGGSDGAEPGAGALIFDASGNIIGTASYGGSGTGTSGYGVVFEIRP
jgi:uncharacterized repeat protein (TIGR03803 family)